ncbi:AGAP000657-PA-like protein [Anopheles sinensis]|uniref:AGAP000657-PA-like protein n=1 Tax=Anopheles sinensis TaxID=74873 RepID=A0A084VAB8_ANOSI|nr:AGAP000657-PA-like protein [Anopheles sinensis]
MVVSGLSYMMYGSVWNLLSIYLYNPLTFYVDTSYLHWNTTFPAISVCQVENSETIAEVSEEYFGTDRDPLVDSLITDIAFYGGTCYSCEECMSSSAASSTVDCANLRNFSEIVQRHRATCDQLLTGCQWQRESFDCCQLFRPLDTEFGRCYTVNTANARPKFVSNRATGPGQLRFRVLEDVQLYLHDEFSVPHAFVDRSLRETVLWGMRKEIAVRVIEMENKDTVQELPIWRRSCRFPWEVVGGGRYSCPMNLVPLGEPLKNYREGLFSTAHQLYRHYSFSTCSLECFRRTQLEYCNCTHHLMPPAINPPRLACLTEHSVEIAQARKQCPCLSSCVEPEYFVVYKSEE